MTQLRLYGTETSPYVRRVRVVALELGVDFELIDTKSEDGHAVLRSMSPIWKVPVAVFVDGEREQPVLDSGVINAHLMRTRGPGSLAEENASDLDTRNILTTIDGALDSLINVFYLAKDGIEPGQASYVAKQQERAAQACAWLEGKVQGDSITGRDVPGLVDIALGTTIGWMQFRNTYPIEKHPGLMRCYEKLAARPSFEQTQPPT
jgi:glutathione S-transferase